MTNRLIWFILILVLIIDITWISHASFQFSTNGLAFNLSIIFLAYFFYSCFSIINHDSRYVITHRAMAWFPHMVSVLMHFMQLMFFWIVITNIMQLFSYLITSTHQPLIDNYLVAFDQTIHFHMPEFLFWIKQHTMVDAVLTFIYNNACLWQLVFLAMYSGLTRQPSMQYDVIKWIVITVLFTIILSGLLPAAGPFVEYHYVVISEQSEYLHIFQQLRSGSFHLLNLSNITSGLITFPSFHTILALIFIYSYRRESVYLFLPILLINTLQIISTVSTGWHYVGDVLGGIVVFVVTIYSEVFLKEVFFNPALRSIVFFR